MVFVGLLAMVAFFVLPVLVAYVAIAPLHRMAKGRGRKVRIYVIDYMALLALVQVVLAICMAFVRDRFEVGLIPAFVLLSLLIVVLWWAGIDVLSQLGIRQASRRLMMHLALLPGVCAIMVGTAAAMGLSIATFSEIAGAQGVTPQVQELLWTTAAVIPGVLVGIWLIRSMGSWIARGEETLEVPTP